MLTAKYATFLFMLCAFGINKYYCGDKRHKTVRRKTERLFSELNPKLLLSFLGQIDVDRFGNVSFIHSNNGLRKRQSRNGVRIHLPRKRTVQETDVDSVYEIINEMPPEDVKLAFSSLQIPNIKPNPTNCCYNGGTCYLKDDRTWCFCKPQFKGRYCGSDVNECTDNSARCPANSTCYNRYGSYGCLCHHGLVERYGSCQPPLTCKNQRCYNRGVCLEKPEGKITCVCKLGYTGRKCEIPVLQCSDSPCGKYEICVSKKSGFECRLALNVIREKYVDFKGFNKT